MLDSIQFNVRTVDAIRKKPLAAYNAIRVDTIDDCNLRCVYCHIPRSGGLLELQLFTEFCGRQVVSTDQLQFGCVMEPTLDSRLCQFMEAAAVSPARPVRTLRLQTNGILLHRHDHARMVAAGLNLLSMSIDGVSQETHQSQRDGASLAKIRRNLLTFRKACPTVEIKLLTTVTTANIDEIDDLILWGLDAGADGFELRQMFHYPQNPIVDHARMRDLSVKDEDFAAMRKRILAAFGHRTRVDAVGADTLQQKAQAVQAASWQAAVDGEHTAFARPSGRTIVSGRPRVKQASGATSVELSD